MRIAVYNFKGGMGKSPIAVNLALMTGAGIVTNELYVTYEKALDAAQFIKVLPGAEIPKIPAAVPIIYDLGGYVDERVSHVLAECTHVVIPVSNEFQALQTTIYAVEEILKVTPRIVIVGTKLRGADFENIRHVLTGKLGDRIAGVPFFPLRHSTAFDHVMMRGLSLRDLVAEGGIQGHSFRNIAAEFDALANHLTKSTTP